MVAIQGSSLLNDIEDVTTDVAEASIQTSDWWLGYALTVHSSQGLVIHDPQNVWLTNNYLQ